MAPVLVQQAASGGPAAIGAEGRVIAAPGGVEGGNGAVFPFQHVSPGELGVHHRIAVMDRARPRYHFSDLVVRALLRLGHSDNPAEIRMNRSIRARGLRPGTETK